MRISKLHFLAAAALASVSYPSGSYAMTAVDPDLPSENKCAEDARANLLAVFKDIEKEEILPIALFTLDKNGQVFYDLFINKPESDDIDQAFVDSYIKHSRRIMDAISAVPEFSSCDIKEIDNISYVHLQWMGKLGLSIISKMAQNPGDFSVEDTASVLGVVKLSDGILDLSADEYLEFILGADQILPTLPQEPPESRL